MKKINSGYDTGAKQWAEMCAEGGKVQVKGYARGGAVKKTAPKAFPKAPPAPTPASKDTPKNMANGGKAEDGKWMQKAFANSHGQFKAKAKKAGVSTKEFAEKKKDAGGKTGKQANLALHGMKAVHKAKGGAVHKDVKQDMKMLKKTVKADCIKGKK